MPRRAGFLEAYCIEPDFGLAGYPDDGPGEPQPQAGPANGEHVHVGGMVPRALPSEAAFRRRAKRAGVRVTKTKAADADRIEGTYTRELGTTPPKLARIILRTRPGFRYERVVGLRDYVTQAEAAKLLALPVMTIHRWVRTKVLKSSKRRGVSVVRFRDLLAVAKDRQRPVSMSWRIEIPHY